MTAPDDPPQQPFTWVPPSGVPPQPGGEPPGDGQLGWGGPHWGPAPQSEVWVPYAPVRTTNGWAVAALVTGILPLPPVAIGCGITALVQTRRRTQAGRGLAIAGLVLGGVWTLIIAVIVIAGLTGALDIESRGRLADVPVAEPGTCLDDPGGSAVWVVADCTTGHDAEVYEVATLDEGRWPGAESLATEADDSCLSAFEGYLGESWWDSDHEYSFFTPDEAEWASGERRAVCVVVPGLEDQLVGSVRGAG